MSRKPLRMHTLPAGIGGRQHMSQTALEFLDLFFVVFHTGFTLFVFGAWTIPRLRFAHRIAVALTAFSWFGLGLFTTIGYCPLTDWHWRVLRALGERGLPRSYVQYLVQRLVGLDVSAWLVDWVVGGAFAMSVIAAVWLWWRERNARTA